MTGTFCIGDAVLVNLNETGVVRDIASGFDIGLRSLAPVYLVEIDGENHWLFESSLSLSAKESKKDDD
jgi:hypothetical protein